VAQSVEIMNLQIDRIVPGGDGMGRHEGRTVFVPLSAPGDELAVRIVDVKPGYLRGEIKQILKRACLPAVWRVRWLQPDASLV